MPLAPAQNYRMFHNKRYPRTYDPVPPELGEEHKRNLRLIKIELRKAAEINQRNKDYHAKHKLKLAA